MAFSLVDGLHIEDVDDGFLVLVPGRDEVVHLRDGDAEALRLARAGIDVVPETAQRSMAGLIELGIVHSNSWSRRRVLQLGGAAAAAAVAVVALPSVAAAGSPPDPTIVPPTTGSVEVRINMMDGLTKPAVSPVRIPLDPDTAPAHLYSSADRSGAPAATVQTFLPANQNYVSFTFTGVAPGTYYADIQQPFDAFGANGYPPPPDTPTAWVDWNYGHRSVPAGYPPKVDEFQEVTVVAGATANVTVSVQVALESTPPPWP